ncbi:MAG: histidine phosphatase family protein [Clostridia bacterium]|nr:histidine phosphatase family protein [Clostridia bacterium]
MDYIVELELYLVRHGESTGNAGWWPEGCPSEDPPLSELGAKQASALGEFFNNVDLDCVLSSGLDRAAETAANVVKRQKKSLPVEVAAVFSECGIPASFGKKSFETLRSRFEDVIPAVGFEDADTVVYAEDETGDTARLERAHMALDYIRSRFRSGEKVMLVGHGAFNTMFLFAALGLDENTKFDFAINNTGVCKLVFFKEGTGPYDADVHLVFHNYTGHLLDISPDIAFTALY